MTPQIKYQLREVTPQDTRCIAAACPAVYEGIRDVTPENYEAEREVYLIIGKRVEPKDAGLESKVGAGEMLIEIPRKLIDDREK